MVFVGPNQRILGLADLVQASPGRKLALIVIEVVENILDELTLIGFVDNCETGGDTGTRAIAAQNPNAHCMERSDPQITRGGADHTLQPRLHLAGGFVGERYRENPIRRDAALFQQKRDAVR
jgi:hypothetical protein